MSLHSLLTSTLYHDHYDSKCSPSFTGSSMDDQSTVEIFASLPRVPRFFGPLGNTLVDGVPIGHCYILD